jgi:hypothetical protein
MDLAHSIEPNSEQLNAEDLLAGPMTVTITGVKKGTADQPVFIQLAEFADRTYRPGKSMRRILVAAWGAEADAYVGRRVTIYNDPKVKWAGQEVGGIRIRALSHITKPLTVALTVTRGKRAPFTVQPIPTDTAALKSALADIAGAESIPALKAAWDLAGKRGVQGHADVVAAKETRKTELAGKDA